MANYTNIVGLRFTHVRCNMEDGRCGHGTVVVGLLLGENEYVGTVLAYSFLLAGTVVVGGGYKKREERGRWLSNPQSRSSKALILLNPKNMFYHELKANRSKIKS